MKINWIVQLLILIFLVSGCSTKYIAPDAKNYSNEKYTLVIDKDFDTVWYSVIDFASKTFFDIKNFEKESGLITLNFGSSDIESFVDCGYIEAPVFYQVDMNIVTEYKGSAIDYFRTVRGGVSFNGRMNLFVKSIDSNHTLVTIRTKYVLKTADGIFAFNSDTNSTELAQLVGRESTLSITCIPTHKAESLMIDAIKKIANN